MIGERRRNRISARADSLEPWAISRPGRARADDSMISAASNRQAQLVEAPRSHGRRASRRRQRGGSALNGEAHPSSWNSPGTNRPGRARAPAPLHNPDKCRPPWCMHNWRDDRRLPQAQPTPDLPHRRARAACQAPRLRGRSLLRAADVGAGLCLAPQPGPPASRRHHERVAAGQRAAATAQQFRRRRARGGARQERARRGNYGGVVPA